MGKVKKSYSKFQYADLWDLGLRTEIKSLFDAKNLKKVAPSDWLLQTLEIHRPISLATEKAKSEFIITPILAELRSRNASIFAIYSGFNFNIDEERGLQGFCDYLLAKLPLSVTPETPIIAVVEAKHNQDLADAVPQCAAEMFAARIWNEKRETKNLPDVLYGVVTSGEMWLFLKLEGNVIYVNEKNYSIQDLPQLLGIWQHIINLYE